MLISSRFRTCSLPCFVLLAGASGCSSSSTTTHGNPINADGGGPATCTKPPATGYTQVVPPSTVANTDVGPHTAMTLSKDGYPVIAYFMNDVTAKTAALYSIRWDPCAGAWAAPFMIDSRIELLSRAPRRDISITTDPVDGRIGIAYTKLYVDALVWLGIANRDDVLAELSEMREAVFGRPELAIRLRNHLTSTAGRGSPDEIARALGLSVRSMQRKLADLGTSFRDEVHAFRTERAKTLLVGSDHSLIVIADHSGFDSVRAFTEVFGKRTGESPQAFRLRIRAERESRKRASAG